MNEYTEKWPLWDENGPLPDGCPQLPEDVAERLRQWALDFNRNFDWRTGWPDPQHEQAHRKQAEELLRDLRRLLGDEAVRLEYWESDVSSATRQGHDPEA